MTEGAEESRVLSEGVEKNHDTERSNLTADARHLRLDAQRYADALWAVIRRLSHYDPVASHACPYSHDGVLRRPPYRARRNRRCCFCRHRRVAVHSLPLSGACDDVCHRDQSTAVELSYSKNLRRDPRPRHTGDHQWLLGALAFLSDALRCRSRVHAA